MIYKEITIKNETKVSLDTEIMYEIASARADGIELLLLNIPENTSDDGNVAGDKRMSAIIRRLKAMKQNGLIQFFAGNKDFSELTTEADFLLNKYPEYVSDILRDSKQNYLYVKL